MERASTAGLEGGGRQNATAAGEGRAACGGTRAGTTPAAAGRLRAPRSRVWPRSRRTSAAPARVGRRAALFRVRWSPPGRDGIAFAWRYANAGARAGVEYRSTSAQQALARGEDPAPSRPSAFAVISAALSGSGVASTPARTTPVRGPPIAKMETPAVDGADGGAELEEAVEQREERVVALAVLHRRVAAARRASSAWWTLAPASRASSRTRLSFGTACRAASASRGRRAVLVGRRATARSREQVASREAQPVERRRARGARRAARPCRSAPAATAAAAATRGAAASDELAVLGVQVGGAPPARRVRIDRELGRAARWAALVAAAGRGPTSPPRLDERLEPSFGPPRRWRSRWSPWLRQ